MQKLAFSIEYTLSYVHLIPEIVPQNTESYILNRKLEILNNFPWIRSRLPTNSKKNQSKTQSIKS